MIFFMWIDWWVIDFLTCCQPWNTFLRLKKRTIVVRLSVLSAISLSFLRLGGEMLYFPRIWLPISFRIFTKEVTRSGSTWVLVTFLVTRHLPPEQCSAICENNYRIMFILVCLNHVVICVTGISIPSENNNQFTKQVSSLWKKSSHCSRLFQQRFHKFVIYLFSPCILWQQDPNVRCKFLRWCCKIDPVMISVIARCHVIETCDYLILEETNRNFYYKISQ